MSGIKSTKFSVGQTPSITSSIVPGGVSQSVINTSQGVPQVSALMARSVSEQRRESLTNEVQQGLFKDGSGPSFSDERMTSNAIVTSSVGMNKISQVVTSGWGHRGGEGDVVKQTPEVYSPLWLNSNLNLPRDRPTINAWCRSFYALNPFVHNSINLHSTYPISKLNIKCHNKDVEKFFNDMIEEIDLMNICVQIAQEYWLLGEAFVYAELDESAGKWSRLLIQNPDYMVVKRTVVANEPIIMLKPDENLKKIIFSNRPADVEQRKQLNQLIVDSVRRGNSIPLDNFNVSHLARRISPYEIRGTGLPVCIFRQLMLFDKLKECYSTDSEVLTDKGFKKITDLVYQTSNIDLNPNYVNGIETDENGQVTSVLTMKEDFKVACVNPETNQIEYHKPTELHMSKYNGKMLHFHGKKVDTLVSPNHKMWVKPIINNKEGKYQKIPANELSHGIAYKLKSVSNWKGVDIDNVDVLGNMVPINVYLKYLGYVISEGCVDTSFNKKTQQYRNRVTISQLVQSPYYLYMKDSVALFSDLIRKNVCNEVRKQANDKKIWTGTICSKDLNAYLYDEIGINGKCDSRHKKIPRWVLNLDKKYLKVLLDSLVDGDGSRIKLSSGNFRYRYSTISKQLADDITELVFKLGFAPILQKFSRKTCIEYVIRWSDTNNGKEPKIYGGSNQRCASFKEVDYDGVVWCFEVPTGLFVTRRNGIISINGNSKYSQADGMINPLTLVKIGSEQFKPTFADIEAWRNVFEQSQYDKDFKIFTHEGVTVERIGYGQGIYDISNDITQIIKEIYVGLQVPSVLMDGGADTTYANGGVALDVLRQRYMQFRNMLSTWLRRKIFAPISKIQGFYDYDGGEKQLIVPEVDWNHMSIFDAGDYIQNLITLTTGEGQAKRASLHTLYRSMGLEYEDEVRRMRKEAIQTAIFKKEQMSLETMDLNALRALDDDDEIPEPEIQPGQMGAGGNQPPLPGELPLGGMDMGGGLGGLPPMPPTGGELPEMPMGGEMPPSGGGTGGAPPPAPAPSTST